MGNRTLVLLLLLVPGAAFADAAPKKRWYQPRIQLEVAGADGASADLRAAVAAAAETWNAVGAGPLFQVLNRAGRAASADRDGAHTVYFVTRGWPGQPEQLALTYTHVHPRTREIVEVDIAINAEHHRFSTKGDFAAFDLQNLLTHELGHALGLPHCDEREATMHPHIRPGEILKRELSPADSEALLALYEPMMKAGVGCSQAASGVPALACLLLVLLVRRSHRRPHRHPHNPEALR